MTKKKAEKIDPFKTRKTKTEPASTVDTVTPPDGIQKAIDLFRDNQEQAKHFEGEATVYKDKILSYSIEEYSKRVLKSKAKTFKLLGHESIVNYIVQDSSAGLSEDDWEEFVDRWGKKAAEELICKDYSSLRFDAHVLESHYEQVVEALQVLPEDVIERLFKPMLMKAVPGAVEKSKKFVKSADELTEMMKQLKIKNYIK